MASFMSYTALVFGEQAIDIVKSIRPLFLTLILGDEHTDLLVRQRDELANDITELVNELGPKIYPEFSNTRIQSDIGADESKVTHTSLIEESIGLFHQNMREGEHAIRNRLAKKQDKSAKGEDEHAPPLERRGSKYKFNPPTPRTMANLNSISPLEFLGTATRSARSGSKRGSRSTEGDDASSAAAEARNKHVELEDGSPAGTGSSTPETRRGLFDFNWEDTSDISPEQGKPGEDGVFFFSDPNDPSRITGSSSSGKDHGIHDDEDGSEEHIQYAQSPNIPPKNFEVNEYDY
ncbi:Glycerol-3-phosphate/dihydroxyacetone phosphate acyltransferase [Dipsacomyces acuminosporus]|nr:Glycerol-3-phosphate/dihydroxyacetone phosphate acyltransferase [Dipsacomyces acuminosporus]